MFRAVALGMEENKMAKSKTQGAWIVPVLLAAIVVLAAIVLLGGETGDISPGEITGDEGAGGAPAGTAVPSGIINTGELELLLLDSQGLTGTSSKALLLSPTVHAKFKADGSFDKTATRYNIMKTHYDEGLEGLTAFGGGTPKDITVSSGEWSEAQLSGKKGDKVLVYTYVDTAPGATDNISTAELMTLVDFYRETGKWVAQTPDGRVKWNLYSHATYDWYDGTDTNVNNYSLADAASALSNEVVTWYSRAGVKGEMVPDGAIYLKAPSNYTAKFKSLTITDKFGHSKKYTGMAKAENFDSNDPRSIASTVLSSATDPHSWYFIGYIPDDFVTLYTSGDKNRMTWELETDSYGSNVTVTFNVVQNAKGLSSNNAPFIIADEFDVAFVNLAVTNSGFDKTGRTLQGN